MVRDHPPRDHVSGMSLPQSGRSGGGRSTKKIYASTLAASKLGVLEFTLRQPLCEINEGLVGKFEDGKVLDRQVCDFFLHQVIVLMQTFAKCYAVEGDTISKQLNYRPIICALLTVFGKLAPARGELLDGEDPSDEKDLPVGFEPTVTHLGLTADDTETDTGSVMSEGTDLSGWSFINDRFTHEDGTSLRAHEAVDVRGYIIDMELFGNPRLPRSLFEMKALNTWPLCLYQAIYYGCGAGIQNIRAGRYKKIHIVVLGIGWAGVAELDPIARLDVGNGNKITAKAVAEFKEDVKGKCDYLEKEGRHDESTDLKSKYCIITNQDLKVILEKEINQNMGVASVQLNANAPAGTIYIPQFENKVQVLVGKATYRELSYTMLRFPLSKRAKVAEDRMVVSGIARIIFGDRVLKWKLPALLALAAKREQKISMEAKAVMS